MSNARRFALIAGAVVVLIAGALIAASAGGGGGGGGSDKTATVTVKGGKASGGVLHATFKKGKTIDLTVKSDVADEIHFHGYDVHKDVKAGGTVRFRMPATIEGRFVVELEGRKQQLAEVDVKP